MLQIETRPDSNTVIITPSGPLMTTDFDRLSKELATLVGSNGKVARLAICADAFPGWADFDAFTGHLKFIQSHQRQIERVAVITDSPFLKMMPNIANPFLQPQIRTFDSPDKEQALGWLRGAGGA